MEVYGVIMAGGGGTRFWPLSRRETPKQLLNLSGGDRMINEAATRLLTVCNRVFVVTNAVQAQKTAAVVSGKIAPADILAEPLARNTAACIGYAAIKIKKEFGDGIMAITPSDAYIRDVGGFTSALRTAVDAAKDGSLVTIGITPTFPATGYGYIKTGPKKGGAFCVERFVEKPCKAAAEEYLFDGGYLWNSGMFVWKATAILNKIQKYMPGLYACLLKIEKALGTPGCEEAVKEAYSAMPSLSIDYGIMEKSDGILVVPGSFGWSDVGSWDMLGAIHPADADGNIRVGQSILVDCANTTAYSTDKIITAVGLNGIIIVQTPDAVMVCPADRAQDVKKIVDELAPSKREDLL